MAHISRLYDVGDPATVLFDFHDPTGAANPFGLKTRIRSWNLGSVEEDQEFFSPGSVDMDTLIHQRAGRVPMSYLIRASATSWDNLRGAVSILGRLLRAPEGRYIHHQPDGQAQPQYADLLAAPSHPGLLRGQGIELEVKVLNDFEDIELLVPMWRQPLLRGPDLLAYVNNALNATLLHAGGPPDSAPGRPTSWQGFINYPLLERIDPVEEAYEFSVVASGASTGLQVAAAADVPRVVPGEYWIWSIYSRLVQSAPPFAFTQPLLTMVNETHVANVSEIYGAQNFSTSWVRDHAILRAGADAAWAYPRFYAADSGSADPGSLRAKVRRVQLEPWHTARDTFNRGNSGAGAGLGKLQSGQLWVPYAGTSAVSGNEAVASSLDGAGRALSMAAMPTAEGEIVIRMHTNTMFAFHGIDGENYLQLRFDVPGAGVTLDHRVNGVSTWTGMFGSIPGLAAGYHAVRIRMEGANVKVYVNETLRIDWTMTGPQAAIFTTARLTGPILTNLTDSKLDSFNFAPLAVPTGPSPFRSGPQTMTLDPAA